MKIILSNVMVDNQEKALQFYTEKLGFVKKTDIPAGEYRFLTVVSGQVPDGVELLLEPMGFEPAKVFQKAMYDSGIPAAVFGVEDVEKEYNQLKSAGVQFKKAPTKMGPVTIAVLDDGCGNWIQIVQK